MGLSDAEFWRITPRQFFALNERSVIAQENSDWRAALITHVLANIWKGKNVKPFKIADFMPKRRPRKETKKARQTPGQMKEILRMVTEAFGGKVAPKYKERLATKQKPKKKE